MLRCSLFPAVWHLQPLLARLLLKKLTPQLTKLRLKKSLAKVLHVKVPVRVHTVKAHAKVLVKALAKRLVKALAKRLAKAQLAKLPKLTANALNAFQFGRGQHSVAAGRFVSGSLFGVQL